MRLGLIVRADKTGLGYQTRNLCYMLKPSKIMVVDSTSFSKNKQDITPYDGFSGVVTKGFPTRKEIISFLDGIDVVLSCETFYGDLLYQIAKQRNVKMVLQYNWEFLDVLKFKNYPRADVYLSPSYWHLEEAIGLLEDVFYLPPPVDESFFKNSRNNNLKRNTDKKKFLHVMGKPAIHDRNGTLDLLKCLRFSESQEYELTIKAQSQPDDEFMEYLYKNGDWRVKFELDNPSDNSELYNGFDALIIPRRYGGLCLPMIEGLMSALPVIMTDISPNRSILPEEWLVKSKKQGSFMARTSIDYYSAIHEELAYKLDYLSTDMSGYDKAMAFEIGLQNFSPTSLKEKYVNIFNKVISK